MEKQIEEMACKNCIHYHLCVHLFRKAKEKNPRLLFEEESFFASADDCDFYADKRIYRKQSDTAREIFAEIDARLGKIMVAVNPNDCFITTFRKTMEKVTAEVEELKKKYTAQSKDKNFVANYECEWVFEEEGGSK